MQEHRRHLIIVLVIFTLFSLFVFISNFLMERYATTGEEVYNALSRILLGLFAIPVLAVFIPMRLASKWSLSYSFWPKTKKWWYVILVTLGALVLFNAGHISEFLKTGISTRDYFIHFISCLLFHVSYYPLFVVFMLPVFRKNFGLRNATLLTALLFAIFHFTQYYHFPNGVSLMTQLFLFISFVASIMLYLWSESIIIVALAHTINGSIELATNGTVLADIDILFFMSVVVTGALFTFMILTEIYDRRIGRFRPDLWMMITIEDGRRK